MQFSFPVPCSKSFGVEQARSSSFLRYSSVSFGVRCRSAMRFLYSSFVSCLFSNMYSLWLSPAQQKQFLQLTQSSRN